MEPKLRRADIVIIASAHNPSIVAPQWLKDNSLIVEKPLHFVNTPDFSLFESESFSLMVDHQRLQITAKKQDRRALRSLANVAANYVRLLPHIPYRSLGLNFLWTIEINEGGKFPRIGLSMNGSNLDSLFEGHKVTYGGIIYARKEPYMLKLVIEPQRENIVVHNFNYHHEVEGTPVEDLARLIDSFLTRYEDSSGVVRRLCLIKEKK